MPKCSQCGGTRSGLTWGLLCASCGGSKEMKDGFSDVGSAVGGVGKAVGATVGGLVASFGGGIGGLLMMGLTIYVALNLDAIIAILVGIFWAIVGLIVAVKLIKKFGLVTTLKYGAMAGSGIFLLLCLYFFVIYPTFIQRSDTLPAMVLVEAGGEPGSTPTTMQGDWLGWSGDKGGMSYEAREV